MISRARGLSRAAPADAREWYPVSAGAQTALTVPEGAGTGWSELPGHGRCLVNGTGHALGLNQSARAGG